MLPAPSSGGVGLGTEPNLAALAGEGAQDVGGELEWEAAGRAGGLLEAGASWGIESAGVPGGQEVLG